MLSIMEKIWRFAGVNTNKFKPSSARSNSLAVEFHVDIGLMPFFDLNHNRSLKNTFPFFLCMFNKYQQPHKIVCSNHVILKGYYY